MLRLKQQHTIPPFLRKQEWRGKEAYWDTFQSEYPEVDKWRELQLGL